METTASPFVIAPKQTKRVGGRLTFLYYFISQYDMSTAIHAAIALSRSLSMQAPRGDSHPYVAGWDT